MFDFVLTTTETGAQIIDFNKSMALDEVPVTELIDYITVENALWAEKRKETKKC